MPLLLSYLQTGLGLCTSIRPPRLLLQHARQHTSTTTTSTIKIFRRQFHKSRPNYSNKDSSSTSTSSSTMDHASKEGKHDWKMRMSDLLEQMLEKKRYSSALLYVFAGFFSIYGSYVIWGWNLRYSNVCEFLKKAGSTQTTEDIFRLEDFHEDCMKHSFPEELEASKFESEFHEQFPKKEVHAHHSTPIEMLEYTNQCIKVALRFSEMMESCKEGNKEQCKIANNVLASRYRTEIRFSSIQLLFENLKLFHWIALPVEFFEARYIFRNNITGERLMQSTLIGAESIKPLFNVALPLRAFVEYKDQSAHSSGLYEYMGDTYNNFTKAIQKSEEKWKQKGVVRQGHNEKKLFQPDAQEVQIVFELVKEALRKHSERKLKEKSEHNRKISVNTHNTPAITHHPSNTRTLTLASDTHHSAMPVGVDDHLREDDDDDKHTERKLKGSNANFGRRYYS